MQTHRVSTTGQTRQPRRSSRTRWLVVLTFIVAVLASVGFGNSQPALDGFGYQGVRVLLIGLVIAILVSLRADRTAYNQLSATHEYALAQHQSRLELARQLHDIISDGLAVIHLRASVANQLSEQDPEQAVIALNDIEHTAQSTIHKLRELLLVIRGDSPLSDLDPNPEDDAIQPLLDRAHHAGIHVVCTPTDLDAIICQLPGQTQRLLVSILRESLANVARHAGPCEVTVHLDRDADMVTLRVIDSGPVANWQPLLGTGLGLELMDAALTQAGGTLSAAPRLDQAGFQVLARIPLDTQPR